jgi:hypothetical protein
MTNKMQLYTIFFIGVKVLHVSGGFFRPSSGAQTVHTASGICQAFLLLPLAWVSWHNVYNVASCWSYLKEYIKDARYHERQKLSRLYRLHSKNSSQLTACSQVSYKRQ